MTLATLDRPSSLVQSVCQTLVGELRREGGAEWLPAERQLAEQLGVSRSVVREATKRLEMQGLVEVRHGIGIRRSDRLHQPLNGSLALLIPDETARLRQSLEARLAIEPEVARLAARRATAGQREALEAAHAALAPDLPLPDAVEADITFHRALAKASGNEVFCLVLETLSDLGRESRRATISHAGIERARRHHDGILQAVLRRDDTAAGRAMKHHIEKAVEDLAATAVISPPSRP
jgi:GntR family transcriptional repressor for pyruvate dehydrogenase complex